MEAAFVDIGKGRNAVLYAGEVNWDAAGLEGQPKRIEHALKSGESVLVQVTKDPIGHKGARLTSQISLPGRYLVYVPDGSMTGISRKLPDTERTRLKKILRDVVPEDAGVIVRTAAEGASEEELEPRRRPAAGAVGGHLPQGRRGQRPGAALRRARTWRSGSSGTSSTRTSPSWSSPATRPGTPCRPTSGTSRRTWSSVSSGGTGDGDVFAAYRIDEQLAKALDRKVWLPSGGSLVIDRTEAMTVVDVNTGKFTGAGGNLEETVTKNNIEAAEEIVRQLRLRDIGGIIVVDFIDMVLESNRELVLRRLLECLGRDRTKHQVAEVTSLGLVQMTRKRVGQGLLEVFSETCEHCGGRGHHPARRAGGEASAAAKAVARAAVARAAAAQAVRVPVGMPSAGSGSGGSGSGGNGSGRQRVRAVVPGTAPAQVPRPVPAVRAVAAVAAAGVAAVAGAAAQPPTPTTRRPLWPAGSARFDPTIGPSVGCAPRCAVGVPLVVLRPPLPLARGPASAQHQFRTVPGRREVGRDSTDRQ